MKHGPWIEVQHTEGFKYWDKKVDTLTT